MNASAVKMDLGPLLKLQDTLKAGERMRVKVGLLAPKASRFDIFKSTRTEDKLNNPSLGLIHEKGDPESNIPPRSFLRMPLETKLILKINQIGKAVWRALLLRAGLETALEELGVTAQNTVQEAFETGGWGQWAPLKPRTIARKGSSAILIDSGQLRRAVSHEVVGGAAP